MVKTTCKHIQTLKPSRGVLISSHSFLHFLKHHHGYVKLSGWHGQERITMFRIRQDGTIHFHVSDYRSVVSTSLERLETPTPKGELAFCRTLPIFQ